MSDDLKKLIDDMSPEEKLLVLSYFSSDREEFLFAAGEAKARCERADGYRADRRDTELERVSGYAKRMEEMVIERDREATQWAERLHEAEAAIRRVREVHDVHSCDRDGHIHRSTPTPCVNDGVCSCGRRAPCPTLAALDSPEET